MRVIAGVAVLLLASMTVVGCATINPRIPYTDSTTKKECVAGDWKSVTGSLECAAVVRNQMDSYARREADIPRGIGAIVIPLAAAIAGLAITGTTGAPVMALTLAGVTTMGMGYLVSSPARRHAFSVGAKATQCVITTTRPLKLKDDKV